MKKENCVLDLREVGNEKGIENQGEEHDGEYEESALPSLGGILRLRVYDQPLEGCGSQVAARGRSCLPGYYGLPVIVMRRVLEKGTQLLIIRKGWDGILTSL
jgi:hypothetical protein